MYSVGELSTPSAMVTGAWRGGRTLVAAGEIIIVQCICKDSSTQYPYYLLITEHNNRTIMCQVWAKCLHASTYPVSHLLFLFFFITRYNWLLFCCIWPHISQLQLSSYTCEILYFVNLNKLVSETRKNRSHTYTHYTQGACSCLLTNKDLECKVQTVEQWSVWLTTNTTVHSSSNPFIANCKLPTERYIITEPPNLPSLLLGSQSPGVLQMHYTEV